MERTTISNKFHDAKFVVTGITGSVIIATKKPSKISITALGAENLILVGRFTAQICIDAESVTMSGHNHGKLRLVICPTTEAERNPRKN